MKYRTIPLLLSALLLTSCDYSFLPQVQDTETAVTEANASFETALTETAASEETSAAAEDEDIPFSDAGDAETSETEASETPPADDEVPAGPPEYSVSILGAEELEEELAYFEGRFKISGNFHALTVDNAEEYPELAKAVSEYVDNIYKDYRSEIKDHIEEEKESFGKASFYVGEDSVFTEEHPGTLWYDVNVDVTRCDSAVLSFVYSYDFMHYLSVHPFYNSYGISMDPKTGKTLTVADICDDIPRLIDTLADKLVSDYPPELVNHMLSGLSSYGEILTKAYGEDLMGYEETYEIDGEERVYQHQAMNFMFVPHGVEFFANTYELADHAAGPQYLTILFSEAEGLFNEKYVTAEPDLPPVYVKTVSDGGTSDLNDAEDLAFLDGRFRFDGSFETLGIENTEDYPLLAKSLSEETERNRLNHIAAYNEFISGAREAYESDAERPSGRYQTIVTRSVTNTVTRSDKKIFSYISTVSNGPESLTGVGSVSRGVTIDSRTGQVYRLMDVCADVTRLKDLLAEALQRDYGGRIDPSSYGAPDFGGLIYDLYESYLDGAYEMQEDGTYVQKDSLSFALTPDGIILLPDLGVRETLEIMIPFSENGDLIYERFR